MVKNNIEKGPQQFEAPMEEKQGKERRERIKSKKELKEWTLEGELTEKDVLAEFKAGGDVNAANFSPDGEKVVIGSDDQMMRVFGRE